MIDIRLSRSDNGLVRLTLGRLTSNLALIVVNVVKVSVDCFHTISITNPHRWAQILADRTAPSYSDSAYLTMTNNKYLRSAIVLTIANSLIILVGVLVMPTLLLATVWALGALVLHFVSLVACARWELMAEFGPKKIDKARRFESRQLMKVK